MWVRQASDALFWLLVVNLLLISWAPVKLFTGFSAFIFITSFIFLSLAEKKPRFNIVDLGVMVFTASVLVSCVFSINPRISFAYFEKLILKPLSLYLAVRLTVRSDGRFKAAFFSLCLSYLLVGLLTLKTLSGTRLGGIFNSPTKFGKFLDLSFPLFLGATLGAEKLSFALVWAAAAVLFLIYLILTGTRGAWVSLAAVLSAWIIYYGLSRRRFFLKIVPTLVLLISVSIAVLGVKFRKNIGFLKARLSSLISISSSIKHDHSIALRLRFYKTAWELFKEKPITGWGFGRKTPKIVTKTLGRKWFSERGLTPFRYHSHNTFLEILFECGILGFLGFLFLILSATAHWKKSKEHLDPYRFSLFLSICAILIHSLVTYFFQPPIIYMFFAHLGLFSAEAS